MPRRPNNRRATPAARESHSRISLMIKKRSHGDSFFLSFRTPLPLCVNPAVQSKLLVTTTLSTILPLRTSA